MSYTAAAPGSAPRRWVLRPAPENLPAPLSDDEVTALADAQATRPIAPPDYIQGSLAVDFADLDDDEPSPQIGPLPDAQAAANTIATAVVEALAGVRPVTQLIRHTRTEVYDWLARRAFVGGRRREGQPVRRPIVRVARVTQPGDRVVEASAVIVDQGRARAMAFRLEGQADRWILVAVALG